MLPEKNRRRSSRGRRASIALLEPTSSPLVVDIPLSDSVKGNNAFEKIRDIEERIRATETYRSKLLEEDTQWEHRLITYSEAIVDQPISHCAFKNDSGLRPRYHLNTAMKAFKLRTSKADSKRAELFKMKEALSKDEKEAKNEMRRHTHYGNIAIVSQNKMGEELSGLQGLEEEQRVRSHIAVSFLNHLLEM